MALLKYVKVEKRSAIEEANKEVIAVLCDPGKRHPYLKILPEQKAIIARLVAMLLITELLNGC